jgi:hypothetical protein
MSEEAAGAVEATEQTPVVETQVLPDAPQEQPQEQEAQPAEENKGKERLTMRFSELTAQRRAAEDNAERARQEADYWRQQALRTQHAEPQDPAYDDYQQPDIAAEVERVLQEREQKTAHQNAQKAHADKAQDLSAKLIESGLEGAILLVTDARAPVTMEMVDALTVSEHAAQIADHLGRNPQETARIASLPPHLQGYELAKLEGRLASQPRTTSALPPPATVGARAVASTDPGGMTFEQYKAARESGRI